MAGLLGVVLAVVLALLGASALLVTVRLVRGPSALDRLVAVDVLVALLLCVLAVTAALADDSATVPVVVATSLVGFLGSTTVARFLGRSDESAADDPGPPAAGSEER